jgi:glycosyltransferase involved in cell wall biosynthesis
MRIHVSAADRYPLRYVDVVELFLGELARHGVEQTWYVQGVGETSGPRTEYVGPVKIIVSPVVAAGGLLGKIASKIAYWSIDTALLLRLLWRAPDLIIVRDKYWASLVGLAVARILRKPFVVWMSYPFPEDDLERSSSFTGPMRLFLKISGHFGRFAYYGIAMRFADHCFVQSERMKLEMHERGIALERMTAVPMGIALDMVEKGEATVPPEEPPVVLYVGGLQVVRRLEMLIDCFAEVARRHEQVQFRVVGEGSVPEDRARLERRAAELGIAGRVQFTGQLPMVEAHRHIARAAVCLSPIVVTPTLRVASPTKFVEYLSWARPTIGNDHPEQSMIAEQSQGAICVEWSAKAFADAIIWCLDHPQQAAEMAVRGRAWVKETRTYDKLGALVLGRLQSIIAQRA